MGTNMPNNIEKKLIKNKRGQGGKETLNSGGRGNQISVNEGQPHLQSQGCHAVKPGPGEMAKWRGVKNSHWLFYPTIHNHAQLQFQCI